MLRGDITGSSLANQYGTPTRREDHSPKDRLKRSLEKLDTGGAVGFVAPESPARAAGFSETRRKWRSGPRKTETREGRSGALWTKPTSRVCCSSTV